MIPSSLNDKQSASISTKHVLFSSLFDMPLTISDSFKSQINSWVSFYLSETLPYNWNHSVLHKKCQHVSKL